MIVTFLNAALYLKKHSEFKIAARECRSMKRSNYVIYIKLCSLMGYTWLFGLLDVLVESLKIFEYLFVILTCLQGIFISVSFVFKKEILKLYRNKMSSGLNCSSPSQPISFSRNTSVETVL